MALQALKENSISSLTFILSRHIYFVLIKWSLIQVKMSFSFAKSTNAHQYGFKTWIINIFVCDQWVLDLQGSTADYLRDL